MDDFLAGKHDKFVNLVAEFIQVVFVDDFFRVHPGDIITVLQAANMLTSDTYHYGAYGEARIGLRLIHGLLDRLNGLGDIIHHPPVHPQTFRPSYSQDLNLAVFVFLPDDGHDLGRSNIQADRIIPLFHKIHILVHTT